MKPNLLKPIVAALAVALSSAAMAAPTSYHLRQFVPGLSAPTSSVPAAPATPSAVGDGTSKAGACASGAATGCATWGSNFYTGNTFSADYLTVTQLGGVDYGTRATKTVSSGKWYWEITVGAQTGTANTKVAALIGVESLERIAGSWSGTSGNGKIWAGYTGFYYSCASTWLWPVMKTQPRFYVGDVVGVALDMDNHTLALTLNGSALSNSAGGEPLCSNLYGTVVPLLGNGGGITSFSASANFGQSAFRYAVPAGYNAGLW